MASRNKWRRLCVFEPLRAMGFLNSGGGSRKGSKTQRPPRFSKAISLSYDWLLAFCLSLCDAARVSIFNNDRRIKCLQLKVATP
jgi:hypothetical protein